MSKKMRRIAVDHQILINQLINNLKLQSYSLLQLTNALSQLQEEFAHQSFWGSRYA